MTAEPTAHYYSIDHHLLKSSLEQIYLSQLMNKQQTATATITTYSIRIYKIVQ